MNIKPLIFGLCLLLPAGGAWGENIRHKAGVFAFLKADPAKAEARAERNTARAERKAARTQSRVERKAGRKGGHKPQSSTARAEVLEGVQYAKTHRPKGRLWCVPFARAVTGVDLRGNAKTWWKQAKGKYARGTDPQIGAVISFAGSRAMPLGHVAVVSDILGPREILITHANWSRGRITQDDRAVDVSAKNDWSKVRVANGRGTLGRSNPVNGFIYN